MQTAQELLDFIMQHAERIYAEGAQDTEHMPIAFVQKAGGEGLVVIGLPIPPPMFRSVFEGLARTGATMIGFVCEGWAAQARDKATLGALDRRIQAAGGVAKLPPDDRWEVLNIEVVTPLERIGASRAIVRGDGKATLGTPMTYGGEDKGWNRFLSDLPWTAVQP